MKYSVVIIGGGPAGLACAKILAENTKDVLLLERKSIIGTKVCAGGITWSGLINVLPEGLEERRFRTQQIVTQFQRAQVKEKNPIIATVNRVELGQYMARQATEAGATVLASCSVKTITKDSITYTNSTTGKTETVQFDYLIGADGSTSLVRRFLRIPCEDKGVGVQYILPKRVDNMEWHLNSKYFKNGYGWIFPHKESVSIGAYADINVMPPKQLKHSLIEWANTLNFDLSAHKPQAEYISFDYKGWNFDNIFLAGDAAGLASGLTGEGIYPAILSGETIANYILDDKYDLSAFNRLIRMQRLHRNMVKLTGKNTFLSTLIGEMVTLGLRLKLIDFKKLEMAH